MLPLQNISTRQTPFLAQCSLETTSLYSCRKNKNASVMPSPNYNDACKQHLLCHSVSFVSCSGGISIQPKKKTKTKTKRNTKNGQALDLQVLSERRNYSSTSLGCCKSGQTSCTQHARTLLLWLLSAERFRSHAHCRNLFDWSFQSSGGGGY
jgi:hypothetical protein